MQEYFIKKVSLNTRSSLAWVMGSMLLGILVYAMDRQGDVGFLLPFKHIVDLPSLFGEVGWYLPTLTHTFAFIILSCCVWATRWKHVVLMCFLWLSIEMVMECIQHPIVSELIKSYSFSSDPQKNMLVQYIVNGTFSISDLVAIVVGSLLAFLLLNFNLANQNDS